MIKIKYNHRRSQIVAMILMLTILIQSSVFGATTVTSTNDYVVIDNHRIAIPKTYIPTKLINNINEIEGENKFFKEPLDLFITDQGEIYIADTGNDRIIKMSQQGELSQVFRGPDEKPLKRPEGIFVDEVGDMYIADTGNNRILHLSPNGSFVEEFVTPESELLDASVPFNVSKLCVSPTGYIYLIRGESIMVMDAMNRFRGYLGQNKVGFSLADTLIRRFASDTQKSFLAKRHAASYINLTLGSDGMIYATSRDSGEGEIKKLNTVGNNIYRKYGEGAPFTYGERFNDDRTLVMKVFSDIAVDQNGIVSVIEESTGKIYQYDQDGNLLTVFGGTGEQKGLFNRASSIDVDEEGNIYVLDKLNNNIQIFKPTYFIELVHQAVTAFNQGKYEEAYDLWIEVLKIDENYNLAHMGLGNALYKQEKWQEAMEEFKLADDQIGYSKAFAEYRYEVFRDYFIWCVLIVLILLVAVVMFIKYTNKISKQVAKEVVRSGKKMTMVQGIKLAFNMVYRPFDTFEILKYHRGRLNITAPIVILIGVFVVRVMYVFITHYPLASINPQDANLVFEAVKILLPALTWVIASFAISSILDGESKIKEIFVATGYCMLPYILIHLPLMILSNVLCANEVGLYGTITMATTIWILVLFFLSIKQLNDYSFWKAILTYILSGLTILLVWFIAGLMYLLTGRLYQFVKGLIVEMKMSWF